MEVKAVVEDLKNLSGGLGLAAVDMATAAPTLSAALLQFAESGDMTTQPIDLLAVALDQFRSDESSIDLHRYPKRPPPTRTDLADVLAMAVNLRMAEVRLVKRREAYVIPRSVGAHYKLESTRSSRFRTFVEEDAFRCFAQFLVRSPNDGSAGADFFSVGTAVLEGSVNLLADPTALDIDIVCSEIPADERPYYADQADRNYLRYARFADLDALIYLKTRIHRLHERAHVTDYVASEYPEREPDLLLIVGGPPWNSVFADHCADLPVTFMSNELGVDDPIRIDEIDRELGPTYSPSGRLTSDIALLVRLGKGLGHSTWLFGGCLTLGVLGAATALLDPKLGSPNSQWLRRHLSGDGVDFVVLFRVWRAGANVALPTFELQEPIALLERSSPSAPFALLHLSPESANT